MASAGDVKMKMSADADEEKKGVVIVCVPLKPGPSQTECSPWLRST